MIADTLTIDSHYLSALPSAAKANAKADANQFRGQLTTWPAVREFVFGGNARFTLRSTKTGMRYTYMVKVRKKDLEDPAKHDDPAYFINLLRGPDNTADYKYIGLLHKPAKFYITAASRLPRTSPSVVALTWFTDAMAHERSVLGKALEFWHEGKCCRCGKALTVPESVARGMGADCAGRRTV